MPAIEVESVVRERYRQGAQERVADLCCPVSYDPRYLAAIPQEVLERDAPGSALILRVTRLTISIGGALAVLAIAAKVLRIEEFAEAAEMVTARVRKLLDH